MCIAAVCRYDSGHKEFRPMSGTQRIGNTAVGVVLKAAFYKRRTEVIGRVV